MKAFHFTLPLFALATIPVLAQDLPAFVNTQLPGLVDTYKGIHAHPELSHHEEKTSALLAEELRKAGFTVTEHVGKYPNGSQAFGVVAILKNGDGPTLLIRTDLDALPVIRGNRSSLREHDKNQKRRRRRSRGHARLRPRHSHHRP